MIQASRRRHGMMSLVGSALACLGLLTGCRPAPPGASTQFVLPIKVTNAAQATSDLTQALVTALEQGGGLESPFPVTGQVISSSDPTSPQGSLQACAQPFVPVVGALPCIILNNQGDFIRLQVVTWQTEAFFMFRFYFAPARGAAIDPTRGFFAVDVLLEHQPESFASVAAAVKSAALGMGAVPYSSVSAD